MKRIICSTILLLFCLFVVNAQNYSKVKISLKNGMVITGKKALVTNESVSLNYSGMPKTYALSDVNIIQAKKGSAGKWALGMGGGCLALGLVTTAINPNGDDVGTLLLGSFLWSGIFAGAGALIGSLTDSYQIVYSKNLSYIEKFDFNFSTNRLTRYTPQTNNFTLSYRF